MVLVLASNWAPVSTSPRLIPPTVLNSAEAVESPLELVDVWPTVKSDLLLSKRAPPTPLRSPLPAASCKLRPRIVAAFATLLLAPVWLVLLIPRVTFVLPSIRDEPPTNNCSTSAPSRRLISAVAVASSAALSAAESRSAETTPLAIKLLSTSKRTSPDSAPLKSRPLA